MFKPHDPLKPRDAAFDEAWHAQTLALAETLINTGHFSANDWANALGAALKEAESNGEPDKPDTYYKCALATLETLVANGTAIGATDMETRKSAWERAYRATPHGQPVKLLAGNG